MKKALLVLVILCSVVSFGFTQIPADLQVQTIQEDGKTTDGMPYTITINYLPATGESFFIFSIKTALFDEDDAMVAIRNRAEQFLVESLGETDAEDGVALQIYSRYVYRGADSLAHDNESGVSFYTSRILFLK